MKKFLRNVKTDTEPECHACCGTTCDPVLSKHQLAMANKHSAEHYAWYLESQAENEKLRVELTVTKRELKNAKKKQGWHR